MNRLWPCIFFSAQEKLLEWTGWSFLYAQNWSGHSLDNIHHSLIFRRFWIILGSARETANYCQLSSECLGWTSTTFEIPWITDSSLLQISLLQFGLMFQTCTGVTWKLFSILANQNQIRRYFPWRERNMMMMMMMMAVAAVAVVMIR